MSFQVESAGTAGYQNWRHLVFLHWRIPPEQLQKLLPQELTVETFDDSAWLGMVPFSMERVRPWWSPAVPGISWFLETNLRTYVRHECGLSAVWFFSLDANSRLAVRVARTFWKLNYIDCRMTLDVDPATRQARYTGQRTRRPEDRYNIQAELSDQELQTADPGTLEFFLLERYHLLTQTPDGRFLTGQVIHKPYPFLPIESLQCRQSFTTRLTQSVANDDLPAHAAYSPGVEVRIGRLQPVP